ncbi:MAG: hypothetical protein S4CHLAM45_00320 [Chlamydiales bacterium]|nr:hypothetical protein [Chlamydiales bacterium]MCH9619357.1 hypothetical protein [Chlamydiales bacterium]MCH9622161.1 hypothetical protein [Chlamydiales bacterium]
MFRSPVIGGGISSCVVGGTSVTAGDEHFFFGLLLDEVEKLDQAGVDKLFSFSEWKAVCLAVAPEKLFGDAGVAADEILFPRV